MADGLNIPGVSDRYKTNDLVQALMEVERKPLKREQDNLETYNKQQDAWRGMNQKMSSLRESSKSLYSFDNPFNNKLASSSDEGAVTVDAGRDASYGEFKIDVVQRAEADRFMSGDIDKDFQVKGGKYTFLVGDKSVEFNWKGGKLQDFVTALNKRSSNLIKASLIGVTSDKKNLLVESLKTGAENRLDFKNDALSFAKEVNLVKPARSEPVKFDVRPSSMKEILSEDVDGLGKLSRTNVSSTEKNISIGARGGVEIPFPSDLKKLDTQKLEFSFSSELLEEKTPLVAENEVKQSDDFFIPQVQGIEFEGISILNNQSESTLPKKAGDVAEAGAEPVKIEVGDDEVFFVKDSYGNETKVPSDAFKKGDKNTKVTVDLASFPDAAGLVVRNVNTGKTITMTVPEISDKTKSKGFVPGHAVSEAQDAVIKYEGITMQRSSNDIDDVVPHVTLHVHDATERSARIKIDPDVESAKDAIITFVGKYNQTVAEMNILSMNKREIVSELDYLTKEEQDDAYERLGMFQGDFSLTNGKSGLQGIISTNYRFSDSAEITLLSQLGISTNAGGSSGGYSASKMRGYLEVDEKKLDEKLKNNLEDIKNMFGYDSDGDLIIDNGIAFKIDKQLGSWVQSGGIISTKTGNLEKQIKDSNTKISKLETQLKDKESELKRKYASMEGSLNGLESQQQALENFSNQNNKK